MHDGCDERKEEEGRIKMKDEDKMVTAVYIVGV
jgi:hypothetical protein